MAKVKGIWIYNPNIVGTDNIFATVEEAVLFTSNGEVFDRMEFGYGTLTYKSSIANTSVQVYSGGWTDENFRIVNFGNEEILVTDQFYAMLTANATQPGSNPDEPDEPTEPMTGEYYAIKKATLEGIGNAVRSKTGKADKIPVKMLATEIESIQGEAIEEYDGTVVIG